MNKLVGNSFAYAPISGFYYICMRPQTFAVVRTSVVFRNLGSGFTDIRGVPFRNFGSGSCYIRCTDNRDRSSDYSRQ